MPATASDLFVGRAHSGPPDPLRIQGLAKRFGGRTVLAGFDLVVSRGEIVGLVGPNGCGKTTTLSIVTGLVRNDGGSVEVAGFRVGSIEARRCLAFIPDVPGGFDELTALEHVRLVAALHRCSPECDREGETMIERFGLRDRRHERLGELSLGLRRRVAMAAALALPTPLVLVDEATATLDPPTVETLRAVLRDRAQSGAGVLLASQDPAFVRATCDRVHEFDDGALVATDKPEKATACLHEALLAEVRSSQGGGETDLSFAAR